MKKAVLQWCEFCANVKGNFIESLQFLENYDKDSEYFYLFPYNARNTGAKDWIAELNQGRECAYIQEETFLKNLFLLRRIIKKHKISVVIHHFTNYKNDLLLKLLFNSKKVIRFQHMMYRTENEHPVKHFIRKILWKNNVFVGVSNAVSLALKNKFKKNPVNTIENSINFERLNNIDEFERSSAISLLMMGAEFSIKGVDLALTVSEKLLSEYNLILYIVVSANYEKTSSCIIQHCGKIPDWVVLLPPTHNIATYYCNTDIFLSPSRSEAFGYAPVEAAWCKRSLIASKIDGQGELKIDGAYWFESENIDEFYQQTKIAIKELSNDAKIKQKELTKHSVEKYYSLERWCQDVVKLIKSL